MTTAKSKWNPPSWPWELEIITFVFFLIALLVPYYFDQKLVIPGTTDFITGGSDAMDGRHSVGAKSGYFLAVAIVAIYIFHLIFTIRDAAKITASPLHLFTPCAFVLIAYYRISITPELENTALSIIEGTPWQALALTFAIVLIIAMLTKLRTYRYMLNFNNVHWEIVSPAVYDTSYFSLMRQIRPLLYPPRRYLACKEGFVIEGWFYAMPVEFASIHSVSRFAGSGIVNKGIYFASSTRHLVRIEMHESTHATYISPWDRDDFVRFCAQHIAHPQPSPHHVTERTQFFLPSGHFNGTKAGNTST